MLNQEQIRGNWKEIMAGIRNIWGDISEYELEQTRGNIQAVSGIVQDRYGESSDSINQKLNKLMDSFDNETNRNMIRNDHQTSYQRNPTSVRNFATTQNQESFSDISTRSPERQAFQSLDDMGGENVEDKNQRLDKSHINHGFNHKEDRIARH